MSDASQATPHSQRLTPNEKAILDRIGHAGLKRIATALWRMKLHLQFTGWLQYLLPTIVTLGLLLIGLLTRLLGARSVAQVFLVLGGLLMAMTVFDLVTVKFRLRIPEHLPQRRDDLGIFDLMRARRSCRSFQTRKLTDKDRNELIGYVRRYSEEPAIGPSPVRFEYISAPLTVWPTVNASEFIVAIAPTEYERLAIIDVGRKLQKMVIKATRMGLGTCWIGPGADQTSVARCLGDRFNAEKDHIICVCAVGYKSSYIPVFLRIFNRQLRSRLPLTSLFFADSHFEQPLNVDAQPFSQFGRTYEACQWSPSSYNGQTTRCVAVVEKHKGDFAKGDEVESHLARFDFYATTKSRYYAPVAVGIWCADWELGCDALEIGGHFAVLSDEQRGVHDDGARRETPKYDVSWILDAAT